MVAVFRYSPVDILSVNLPPSVLDFAYPVAQDWLIEEAGDVCSFEYKFVYLRSVWPSLKLKLSKSPSFLIS